MKHKLKQYCLMTTSFSRIKPLIAFTLFTLYTFNGFSQNDTSTWKAQFAIGVNSPEQSAFVSNFEGKSVNFPTFNIGVQRMFSRTFGAKLDYGYNRISDAGDSPEFKVNYSRINAQAVYDAGSLLNFLPRRFALVAHGGPGFTFVKSLGDYPDNDTSFLNAMLGIEFHYGLSETLSVFLDTSYIHSFSSGYGDLTSGFGTFNGSLFTVTLGISISLSGCYYCE